jgi:subtilisin family serine protease
MATAGRATAKDAHRPPAFSGGSNFGFKIPGGVRTGISVTAPGIAIPTTLPNDGVGNTGMTSAAAPQLSGLAALLRTHSVGTNEEIRHIIEASATKAGGVQYAADPDFPSGTHNSELGYGLINVMQALQMATP